MEEKSHYFKTGSLSTSQQHRLLMRLVEGWRARVKEEESPVFRSKRNRRWKFSANEPTLRLITQFWRAEIKGCARVHEVLRVCTQQTK